MRAPPYDPNDRRKTVSITLKANLATNATAAHLRSAVGSLPPYRADLTRTLDRIFFGL